MSECKPRSVQSVLPRWAWIQPDCWSFTEPAAVLTWGNSASGKHIRGGVTAKPFPPHPLTVGQPGTNSWTPPGTALHQVSKSSVCTWICVPGVSLNESACFKNFNLDRMDHIGYFIPTASQTTSNIIKMKRLLQMQKMFIQTIQESGHTVHYNW